MLLAAIMAKALAGAVPQPATVDANPAIWVVRDQDTTVYLFGTFHALDGRSEWFNDEVGAAFAQSDELVLETVLPKLDPPPAPRVRQGPGNYGVNTSASFLGATRMAVNAGKERGLDVRKGADMVLRRAAEESGKKIEGLESVEFQLSMLSRMAGDAARPGAPIAMDPAARARMASVMAQMQASWNRGDQGIFVQMLDQMRRSAPDNYRVMFPERNDHWAGWIVHRMQSPGTVFVAVGAGHFAGPDSVIAKLYAKGLVAARLN
jgi:uncharacterized protein YbaP (TraB family)